MDRFKNRPLSWSQISSFEYNRDQWYDTYILGNRQSSREMEFGSIVDKKIQNDPTFLPTLPRYPKMQYKVEVTFNKIPLVGHFDGLSLDDYIIADYKTGKKPWDQKRADETGQLTMYLFMLYIEKKIKPEQFRCFIHWIPTVETKDFKIELIEDYQPVTIETKRTMTDILKFGERINRTVKEMEEYIKTRQQLIHTNV